MPFDPSFNAHATQVGARSTNLCFVRKQPLSSSVWLQYRERMFPNINIARETQKNNYTRMRDKKKATKNPKITRSDYFRQAKCHNIQWWFVRRTRVNGLQRFYTLCVISEGHLRYRGNERSSLLMPLPDKWKARRGCNSTFVVICNIFLASTQN